MTDLFHVLLSGARDRAAGIESGAFDVLSPEAAAGLLVEWDRLAALVRRNVSPVALWIEAVARVAAFAGR